MITYYIFAAVSTLLTLLVVIAIGALLYRAWRDGRRERQAARDLRQEVSTLSSTDLQAAMLAQVARNNAALSTGKHNREENHGSQKRSAV